MVPSMLRTRALLFSSAAERRQRGKRIEKMHSSRHNNGAQRRGELTGEKSIGPPCRSSVGSSGAYNLLSTHFNYNHARDNCQRWDWYIKYTTVMGRQSFRWGYLGMVNQSADDTADTYGSSSEGRRGVY